jgi:hypothetical protein
MQYRQEMIRRFWEYKQQFFGVRPDLFDADKPNENRPPVFLKSEAHHNILLNPDASPQQAETVFDAIPTRERHRWFRSMSSSQALAQSVFGNLKAYGKLHLLHGLLCEDGLPAFDKWDPVSGTVTLEHKVGHLGEPRPTSIDVFFSSGYSIAVECKLTEQEVGSCSRPDLTEKDPNYNQEYCDGSYRIQYGRSERCPLTQIGVLYWRYVPNVFHWKSEADISPCPLNKNYQLVRNVLTVAPDGDPEKGHAILLYDARNPAFQPGGDGYNSYLETRQALRRPALLRRCSWQNLLTHMRRRGLPDWLSQALTEKYGI